MTIEPDKILFRKAKLEDKAALLVLEQAVVDAERPYNSQIKPHAYYYNLNDLLQSENAWLQVAEYDNEIIATGYVQIRPSKQSLTHANHGYLGFMFVSPEFRGQGLNKKIIQHLMSWAESKGVYDFYLDVYNDNQAAINAYQKLGFKPSLLEMKVNTKS
ncbi:GNAT family N-acetyltransferase [Pseudoalteromonas obscura]|uniref:GNAT family N-acetyltransferase n=1 Tax=Pseudoalteromonas obscura TaxID=3048491 RepID=A0ABT7EMC9_9GAMM|nr:GNAT family N-acetyltransferase [Pseudoalteromonas sp. P94(2023)]MDK2596165.1 GNAT family N-acetyltransferase [Pseudoalteromonas sp. P94(2023)]